MLSTDASGSTEKQQIKAAMRREIERLGETDARTWEQATFHAVTGEPVDNVDWDFQDNVSGYRLWMSTFEQLAKELAKEGYVEFTHRDAAGIPYVRPLQATPIRGWN